MKQFLRFFFRPDIFINQLQWSRNHGLVIIAFLAVALLESQVGAGKTLNLQLSWLLSDWWGIARNHSLFVVMALRMGTLLLGAFCLSESLWWLGTKLGYNASQRVLFRRLTVVLTILLAGYTVYRSSVPAAQWVGGLVSFWGLLFGYFTIREQFNFGRVTALAVGLVACALIHFGWQASDRFVQTAASLSIAKQIAKSPR